MGNGSSGPSGISISAIPDCISELKDGISDLNRQADEAAGFAPDDTLTPDDFDYLSIANPGAVERFGSFRGLEAYVEQYEEDHRDDPRCQQESGTAPEPFAIYLSQIPQCLPAVRDEFVRMETMASGTDLDGVMTAEEFRRLKRNHPTSTPNKTFWELQANFNDAINDGWCSPACDSQRRAPGSEDAVCMPLMPPVQPPRALAQAPQRKKPRHKPPEIAKADPPPEPTPQPSAPPPPPSPPRRDVDPSKINIHLTWGAFEATYGADQLEAERDAYADGLMQRRRRGPFAFGQLTAKTRAAMENNRSWVALGSPEPIGGRMPAFRSFLEIVHDRLHVNFAEGFLNSLSSLDPADPLNNMNLMAKLEFEILEDGSAADVHVIQTSGISVFDAAAVTSIFQTFPAIPPPEAILSYNRRVYVRWGFYRNQRMCGPFNAEPYILSAPGAAEKPVDEKDLIMPAPPATAASDGKRQG